MTGKTMSGMVLTGHGDFDKLSFRSDLPRPDPKRGEVLVRVRAAAVNNTDINTRIGWYTKRSETGEDTGWAGVPLSFPLIQGIDACGIVESVGAGVDPAMIGKRVLVEPCIREAAGQPLETPWFLGSELNGAFAEYLTVAARHAYPVQSDLPDVDLASFPCSYSTAENMLVRAGAAKSDRVLVTGASGGVGSATIQLLQARGAEVVAVSRREKADTLRALGAASVIERDATLPENSFDLVVDLVGGNGFPNLLAALKPGGRYAVAGAVAGADVALDLRTLYLKDLSFFGCTVLGDGVFAGLVQWIETGAIKPLVAETYPLRALADAQAAFLEHRHVGKIGIAVDPV